VDREGIGKNQGGKKEIEIAIIRAVSEWLKFSIKDDDLLRRLALTVFLLGDTMTENGIQGKPVRIFYVDGRTPDGRDHIGQKDGVVLEVNSNFIMLQPDSTIGKINRPFGLPRERIVRVELLEEVKKP